MGPFSEPLNGHSSEWFHASRDLLLGCMVLQYDTGTYLRTPVPERAC